MGEFCSRAAFARLAVHNSFTGSSDSSTNTLEVVPSGSGRRFRMAQGSTGDGGTACERHRVAWHKRVGELGFERLRRPERPSGIAQWTSRARISQ